MATSSPAASASEEKETKDNAQLVKELDESEKLVKKILFYKNPFDQLGVTPETSNDDIRRAFRKLSLKVHPDRCHCEGATEASMALSKALAIVQDSEQRKPYVELTIRARQKIRDDWERAGRAWRTRVSPSPSQNGTTAEEEEEEVWKEDEEYLYEVRRAIHTMILQIEDRQAAQKKVAKIEEEQLAEAEKKEEERAKQERERDRTWEKQRDLRVNDWRTFQKQMKQPPSKKARSMSGMAKPMRPPPVVRESRPGMQQMPQRRF